MQTAHLRHQFHLYRAKIGLLLLLTVFASGQVLGQARYGEISKAGQDDKLVSYGFFLATHTNQWRLKYSDAFLDPNNATLRDIQSIVPVYTAGFSLGFLVTFRLHDQANILFTPKVGFYEFRTDVNTFSVSQPGNGENNFLRNTETYVNEATMVEFPLLFKYKAQRFNNTRMFFTGGGSYVFRTKEQEEADIEDIATLGRDVTLDLGMGFDFYFKYFKFSPEIRFSHGLLNMYKAEATNPAFRDAISEMRRKSITLYLHFQ
jgi:hypothetical protein